MFGNKDQLLGIIRHIVTFVGGLLVAKGKLDPGAVETIAGIATAVMGFLLSVMAPEKTMTPERIVAAMEPAKTAAVAEVLAQPEPPKPAAVPLAALQPIIPQTPQPQSQPLQPMRSSQPPSSRSG